MKRFHQILYLADTAVVDTKAFEKTVALALDNSARLNILAVREPLKGTSGLESDLHQLLTTAVDHELNECLEKLAHIAHAHGLRVGTRSRLGEPFLEAIHSVIDEGHDLLVKTANPPDGALDWLLGGTDHHLLRKCPCPVWIEPSEAPAQYGKILAAIDPMTDDELGLNRTILELASSMAARQNAELHVVHAWRVPGESLFTSGRAQVAEDRWAAMKTNQETIHQSHLDNAVHPYERRCSSIKTHLVEGEVSHAILSTAREENCDLLVMGTVGRIGIPGLFIGNTAEEVLGELPCGVLAIKPPGFRSPVDGL